MPHPLLYTFTGLAKRLWLGVTRRRPVVAGACNMCGWCCTRINLSYRNKWITSEKEFLKLCEQYEDYRRFEIIERTMSGLLLFRCRFLDENNLCADHENRPDYCRDYPHPDLVFLGGSLHRECGYRIETAPDFQRMLKKQLRGPQNSKTRGPVMRRGSGS